MKQIEGFLKAFAEALIENSVDEDGVVLAGLGRFYTVVRPARECRNPKTGETMDAPAKRVVKFKPGKAFSDFVADRQ